jgi:hypothetical protein
LSPFEGLNILELIPINTLILKANTEINTNSLPLLISNPNIELEQVELFNKNLF